jgi:large subunit ribosomal protein L15
MPLQRRLPKRGFINPFRKEREVVNVRDLAQFDANAVVGPEDFLARRMVSTIERGVKVLAVGEVNHPLTVRAQAFSAAAKKKIEAAGGTVEVIGVDESASRSDENQRTPEQGS